MDSQKPKTPQEELEELLRQAGGQTASLPVKKPASKGLGQLGAGLTLAKGGIGRIAVPKFDSKWLMIAGLSVVLLIGTVFFVSAIASQKNSGIVVATNEADVHLTVGRRDYGTVSSGFRVALRPGTYKIEAGKDGFLTFVEQAIVVKDEFLSLEIELLPIPELKKIGDGLGNPRLSSDGTEVSYLDQLEGVFKTQIFASETTSAIFRGGFAQIKNVIWSATGQAAIVQFEGMPKFANSLDNRGAQGRYIPLGERPSQAPTKSNGVSTWLFDDRNKTAEGWQPILLNENIRRVGFSVDGSQIIYLYESADGEYSLISAQPDGLEWERVISDMPRMANPRLIWGPDSRYLGIVDGDKVYVADLLAKVVEQVFTDWVVGSDIVFDPSGMRIAYLASKDAKTIIKIYDLLERSFVEVPEVTLTTETRMVWVGMTQVLVAGGEQGFKRIDVDTGAVGLVPFSGTTIDAQIEKIEYSALGRVLMIATQTGVYFMKI